MKVYDTMAMAASAEKLSKDLLSKAKKLACPNFKGGRVVKAGLQKWIADHKSELDAMDTGSLKDQKTAEEIRKLKIKNDRDEAKLILKSDVAASIRRVLGQVSSIAESKLVNEWPTAVAGLDVAQARIYGRRLHDALMLEYQKLAKEFPE
jgi:hypothetical protein